MMKNFIAQMPKVELHLHIEGTLEPELLFEIAQRNQVPLKYESVEALKAAYNFSNLQDFLDIYYAGAGVLLKEQDFYDLTWAYLQRIHRENVRHTEVMFDPQTHTDRGVPFEYVIKGIRTALEDGHKQLGISYRLIMSFLRHLDQDSAFETLAMAAPYRDWITGIGLDSSELDNPPSKFKLAFDQAIEEGYIPVAHAGEEGPAEYVWEAIDLLGVKRLDHGNRSLEDPNLVAELQERKIGLTVCPLSNLELCVVDDLKAHPMRKMLARGLKCTVNSDDPAYFGGYMNANYQQLQEALDLSKEELYTLASNAIEVSFLAKNAKTRLRKELDAYFEIN